MCACVYLTFPCAIFPPIFFARLWQMRWLVEEVQHHQHRHRPWLQLWILDLYRKKPCDRRGFLGALDTRQRVVCVCVCLVLPSCCMPDYCVAETSRKKIRPVDGLTTKSFLRKPPLPPKKHQTKTVTKEMVTAPDVFGFRLQKAPDMVNIGGNGSKCGNSRLRVSLSFFHPDLRGNCASPNQPLSVLG